MPIIKHITGSIPESTEASVIKYPYNFVSEKRKESETWQKQTMDYWMNVAMSQHRKRKKRFTPNYELIKGILKPYHFYSNQEVQSFMEENEQILPSHIQHYSIISAPLNEMVGEMSKRPDTTFVKAFDEESQTEKKQYRQDLLNQYFSQLVNAGVSQKVAGMQIEDPEQENQVFQQLTEERLKQLSQTYSTTAEKWGSINLEALKVNLNVKEKSEEAFRDYLHTAEEHYLIYQDNSKLGLNFKVLNPHNVWYLMVPNQKYISDPLNPNIGAYAAGTSEIMEISEIIHSFNLTKKEVDHLYKLASSGYEDDKKSNFFTNREGESSIDYNTYDPLSVQERIKNEAFYSEDSNDMDEFLGIMPSVTAYGDKFLVIRAYWCSKKKVGSLTYTNDDGLPETVYVDENYTSGDMPTETSLEWTWENQWYEGIKIGPDIYYVKPYDLLPYCPIIGIVDAKNTRATSFVDMSKPFQMMYNVFFNKAFEQMQKDSGMVELWNLRTIPTPKDGDPQDAIEIFEDVVEYVL